MQDIKDLTLDELKAALAALDVPGYRAVQVFDWIYKKGVDRFEAMTNLPAALREKLEGSFTIGRLELEAVTRAGDGTEKYLFLLPDGLGIESVLIPSGQRRTLCLSTQAGCKFRCAFCASGRHGFFRDLTASEIVGQALFLKDNLEVRTTNIVFMGMGEPLDNFEQVGRAIAILNAPEGLGLAARRMTVSTVGIIPGIERFKQLGLQVNLSISLHAADEAKRSRLLPVNKIYPLAGLIAAAEDYLRCGGRKITLEYVLLKGVNDTAADAEGLARIARRLRAKVNVIPYSPVDGFGFETPDPGRARQFVQALEAKGVSVTLRDSKGRDIQAACGQLAGRVHKLI
jgi:23S rRNA (adenine2503-C2)-methyltransferase